MLAETIGGDRSARCPVHHLVGHLKSGHGHQAMGPHQLAERVGFEPTCPLLAGKTLSRRPRYDHFGTSPQGLFLVRAAELNIVA